MDPRQLFRENVAFVWRALRYQGIAERDLEDVSQEVFVVLFRKLPELERESSFRAWLYGICLRVAAAHRRRASVRHEILVGELAEEAGGVTNSRDPERLHARTQLHKLLARLDDEKRDVFVLYELEQLPMSEVAEIVGCQRATAYSRLAAAREQLLGMISKLPKT